MTLKAKYVAQSICLKKSFFSNIVAFQSVF